MTTRSSLRAGPAPPLAGRAVRNRGHAVRRGTGWPHTFQDRVANWHPVVAVLSVIVVGYALVCLVFTGIGLLITHNLHSVTRWDESVNRWFAGHRTNSTNGWTGSATTVADTMGIVAVLLAAVIVLFLLRRRWSALLLMLAVGVELGAFLTVNAFVGRPRPDVVRLGSLPSTSSFPSGHTAVMVALYGGLAVIIIARFRSRVVAWISWIVVVAATTVIGFGRVYRGMHHPSDVIAGALLGLAVLGVAVVAVRVARMAVAARHQPPVVDRVLPSESEVAA